MVNVKAEVGRLKAFFDALNAVDAEEVTVKVGAERRMSSIGIGPSQIMLCSVSIPVESDGECEAFIDVEDAYKVTRGMKAAGETMAEMSIENPIVIKCGRTKASFRPLATAPKPKIPELPYSMTVETDRADFKAALETVEEMWGKKSKDDYTFCKVYAENGNAFMKMYDEGGKIGREVEIDLGPCQGAASSIYDGRYVGAIIKACPNGPIKISLSTDMPMRIDAHSDDLSAICLVAPRAM